MSEYLRYEILRMTVTTAAVANEPRNTVACLYRRNGSGEASGFTRANRLFQVLGLSSGNTSGSKGPGRKRGGGEGTNHKGA